jgi:hypothetical protein
MRWRYLYPQAEFPYDRLVEENRSRGRLDPEFELLDTGVFDGDRFFEITIDYAKAGPDDWCIRLSARNAGPEAAELHVLPTLWFRNVWSWGLDEYRPRLSMKDGAVIAEHRDLPTMALAAHGQATALFCDNDTNAEALFGAPNASPFPKDAIDAHILHGHDSTNPDQVGTKAALWHQLTIEPGQAVEIRLRFGAATDGQVPDFDQTMADREREADAFYASLTPAGAGPEEAMVMRQAFAGMLWGKQFFHYDIERWLEGDPAQPTPPPERWHGRNSTWLHLSNKDVLSMPDPWEYPWFAAWDLAFHTVALAHLDAEFAKGQLILLLREWYQHPNGQLPAYEWAFSDVNPPVHAWAALKVFEIDGAKDFEFLERVMLKLLLNFTWWVNRKDSEGNNVFEGGFLGLDNIGPIDRSAKLPVAGHLEQSDGTAWMAMYCLNLWEMALILAEHDDTYEDLAIKFSEHFAYIANAMYDQGLWNEEDGFYEDVLHLEVGEQISLRVRSMVGLIPLAAATTLGRASMARLPNFTSHFLTFLREKPKYAQVIGHVNVLGENEGRLLSIVDPGRLGRILSTMLSEDEFLSPHGLRALSRYHLEHPFELWLDGQLVGRVDYEPAESTTGLFGGNSNWRGPVWFPVNYLVIEALRVYHRYLGDEYTVELPTGSGRSMTLAEVADELSERLISIFLDDANRRRPVFGPYEKFQTDPAWHGLIPFHEYFHGDTGEGLGASHQTGWTGLVADLIIRRGRPAQSPEWLRQLNLGGGDHG